jgi:hypothetical protein
VVANSSMAKCVDPLTLDASPLSRRQALGRISRGALIAGTSAWVVPEILIARPTAAGALSSPGIVNPVNPGDPGDPGGSGTPGGGSPVGIVTATGAPSTAASGGVGAGGGASSQGGSDGGGVAYPPSTKGKSAGAPSGSGDNGVLAFTGFDALRDAELGASMIVGGWALTRWASKSSNEVAPISATPDDPPHPGG